MCEPNHVILTSALWQTAVRESVQQASSHAQLIMATLIKYLCGEKPAEGNELFRVSFQKPRHVPKEKGQ